MDVKLFKAVQTFFNPEGAPSFLTLSDSDFGTTWAAEDPTGSMWRTLGYLPMATGEHVIDVDGARLLFVQLAERILPASVIKEKVAERARAVQEREGRKISRKHWMEFKDDVVQELLPKSHIRRKIVPVMFSKGHTFVFTSSAKTCDEVMALLLRSVDDFAVPVHMGTLAQKSISSVLTSIARDGSDENDNFQPGAEIVLKGKDKQTIRVKDKAVDERDVQALLDTNDYHVSALALTDGDEGAAETVSFNINENLVISRLQMNGVSKASKDMDDTELFAHLQASAWIIATELCRITTDLSELFLNDPLDVALSKLALTQKVKPASGDEDDDDDDEL